MNTRCLFYSLTAQNASEDNITLCPFLDYANHSFSAPDVNTARLRERGYPIPTFLSPPDLTLEQGEQVFLRYGSHSRCELLTEYGFVDMGGPIEVSVDDLIEELFENAEDGLKRRELLEGHGYWGFVQIWCLLFQSAPTNHLQGLDAPCNGGVCTSFLPPPSTLTTSASTFIRQIPT